jgi:hypothetical protein
VSVPAGAALRRNGAPGLLVACADAVAGLPLNPGRQADPA